jgi:hypothetical protein
MSKTRRGESSTSIKGENVVGTIIASGRANVRVSQKIIHQATPELDKLFQTVHKEIKERPADPAVDKAAVETQVKKIEKEAAKAGAADQGKLETWVKKLAKMAPDIVDVMAASLGGPAAGFTAVFKKIVERARAEPAGK